jgi:hypothetical protein
VPAPRLQLELRDDAGLLVAADEVDTATLGWHDGGLGVRLEVPESPLQFGRFHLRLGLLDADGDRLLHWLDDAVSFLVYPDGEGRGLVRLAGKWTADAKEGVR